jgi:predicted naringenin-chalcone synthase
MSQIEAADLARQVCCTDDEQARLLSVLYRRAGVQNRYTIVPHQTALGWNDATSTSGDADANGSGSGQLSSIYGPSTGFRMQMYTELAPALAERAASEALARSEVPARDITHLITVSCTGFMAPGIDVELIGRLGMLPTVQRTHIGFMGCHGAINGLRVARGLIAAEPQSRLLLCAVELCCIHFCTHWEPARIVGNAVFSDGAAALVGSAEESVGDWRLAACGSCLIPESTDAMRWAVGDHGFEMVLSPRVPDLIRDHLREWLVAWLDQQGLKLEEIASWAVHPGGPRILSAVEQSLDLPREATATSREVLAEFGNMSSPTVLFILDRLRKSDAPRPCVALGFGPGLVAEAALFL